MKKINQFVRQILTLTMFMLASSFGTLASGAVTPATISASQSPSRLIAGQPFSLSWNATNMSTTQGGVYSCSSSDGAYSGAQLFSGTSGTFSLTSDASWAGKTSSCAFYAWYSDGSSVAVAYLTLSFNAGTAVLTPPSLNLSCGSSSSTAPTAASTTCSMSNSGQTAASGISYSGPSGTTVTGSSSCAANSSCGSVTVRSATSAGTYAGTVTATPSSGSGASSSVSLTVNAPAPAAPTIAVWRSMDPLVSGSSYTTTWLTTNATSVSYTCTASGTGFAGSGSVSPVNGTSAPNVAPSAWVGYPTTCTWTATGPGGSAQTVEGFTTVAGVTPAALSLSGCSNNSGTVTPTAASMTCNLSNTGGTAATGISYGSIPGMSVNGPTGSCVASSSCGQVVVTTGTAAGTYAGTLSVTASGGISTSKSVNLLVNSPPAALNLSGCSVNSPTTSPTAASMSCSLSNTGGTAISSISYSGLTGMTVSGPTGSCAASSNCGTVNVTTGTAANIYNGTLSITPNTGTGTSTAVNLQVTNKAVLQFSACSINSPSNSPAPASMTCTLSNAGLVDITAISYSALPGMTVTGPIRYCEAGDDCGTVTITTGTAQGTYAGTLTATSTPNTGSNASIGINLVVSPPLTPPSLSFVNCTSNNSTTSPTPATTQCTLRNTGQTAVNSISYSGFAGVSVSGPTGACASESDCGQVTVTTNSAGNNYSGSVTASPDTGSAASMSINLTVIALANLELLNCEVNSPTLEPIKATRQCDLRNLGGNASTVNHAVTGGMTVTGPSSCAAYSTNCGKVVISTPALAGLYSGTYTSSTPNGTGQNMPVSLTVQKNPPVGTLKRTAPADIKLTIGQIFTLTWTLSNATTAKLSCTDGAVNYDLGPASLTGGSLDVTARTEWQGKNIGCSLSASNEGGNATIPMIFFDVTPPKPTIEATLSPLGALTVGQAFTTRWNTTNADSVSYSCTPNSAEYGGDSGLATSGETASTIAKAAWVGTSGVCVWTATGGGGATSTSINIDTVYPTGGLSLNDCQINSGTLEPQAATYSCKVSNAGAPISNIDYNVGGGLLIDNAPNNCGAMIPCGDLVIKTPNVRGTYAGNLTITPSSGSQLLRAISLEVTSLAISANLLKLEPAADTINVGKTIRFSASISSATTATLRCTPTDGVEVDVVSAPASGGEFSFEAKPEWQGKQVNCVVVASSSHSSTRSNVVSISIIAPLPTLKVEKISKPDGSVINGPVWVGGSFLRNWKVTDATYVSYSCFAQPGGFNETNVLLARTINTSAEGETPVFQPKDDWVYFSSGCTWTVDGEGGTIHYIEPIQTVALGVLQLQSCEQPNPVIYPSKTVLSCMLKNTGKQAVQSIRYETTTGLQVSGPQTSCDANTNCGRVTVNMSVLVDQLNGSLSITPDSGAGFVHPISFKTTLDAALSFGTCTFKNNVMTPGIAEARCPLLNRAFNSADLIEYQGPAGVMITGPTLCAGTYSEVATNCGEVLIRTLGPAGNYQGLVTATPSKGYAASFNLDLTVRSLAPEGLIDLRHQSPVIAGEPLRLNWTLSATSTTKNAELSCTSLDGITIASQSLSGMSGQAVIPTDLSWVNKTTYCSIKAWNLDNLTEITSGSNIKFEAMTQDAPRLSLTNCQTNAPTHAPEAATYICQLRNHGRTAIGRITYDLIPGMELTVPSSCPAATATEAASCGTMKVQTESAANNYFGVLRIVPDVGQSIVERINFKVDPAAAMGLSANITLSPNRPVAGKNFEVRWTSTNASRTTPSHLYCSFTENGLSQHFVSLDLAGNDGEITLATKAQWVGKQADCGIVFYPESGGEPVMRSAYFQFAEAATHPATIVAQAEPLPLIVGDKFKIKWATTYASTDPAYPTRFSCTSENGGYTELRYLSGASGEFELIVDEKWAGKQSTCSFWAYYEDNTNVAISYLNLDFKATPPTPTINVTHSPDILVAGEPFTLTWTTTNASPTTLPTYVCESSDGGYATSAYLPSYQGTLNLIADKNWGGTHSKCRFGVLRQYDRTGVSIDHDLEFVGQNVPNLQLLNCKVDTRVTTPAQASVVCDMRNSGAKNATTINISPSDGIEIREAPVSCAAGVSCGKVSLFASKVGRYQDIISFIPDMLVQGATTLTLDLEVLPAPTGGGTPNTGGGGTTPAPQVKGDIDGIRVNNDGILELTGWACLDASTQALSYSVYTEASSKLGGKLLATGIANIATENHQSKIEGLCHTPGIGHSFVVNVSADALLNAGKPLFVEVKESATSTAVELPCSNHNCTMPGAIRIGVTTPKNNDRYTAPATVFMQALVANTTDPVDEVAFNINGEWIPAQADSKPNTYFAQKAGLEARAAAYPVSVRVKQGSTILTTTENLIYVDTGSLDVDLNIITPAANASAVAGSPVNLDASAVLKPGSAATIYAVNFYANNAPIGVASKNASGRWVASWTPIQDGSVILVAKAFDADGKELGVSLTQTLLVNSGGASNSTPIPVDVDISQFLSLPDAGSLPGNLSVAPSGAATYSIALDVPPGTAGMQPKLSLDYSSQSQNSRVGLGWNLGGFSSIHRCGKTIAQDGINGRISFDENDRLCLDGQRLILVNLAPTSTNYWANGAEFRTELESFTKIVAVGTVGDANRSYEVRTKDGRISTYGGNNSSTVKAILGTPNSGEGAALPQAKIGAQSWALNRVEDRIGNYIQYDYNQDPVNGEHRPSEILYGGKSRSAHAKVAFSYEFRNDAWTRYIDETRNDLRSRLTAITTYADIDIVGPVSPVRTTTLSYEYSPSSGRSLLQSVEACARNPGTGVSECLPKTTFNWGKPDTSKSPGFTSRGFWDGAPTLTTHKLTNGPNSNVTESTNQSKLFAFADFENRGRMDILEKNVPSALIMDDSNWSNPYSSSQDFFRSQYRYFHNTGSSFSQHNYRLDTNEKFIVLNITDFDGDGSPDLLVSTEMGPKICISPLANGIAGLSEIVFKCASNAERPAVGSHRSWESPYVIDIKGDGRSAIYSQKSPSTGISKLAIQNQLLDDSDPPVGVFDPVDVQAMNVDMPDMRHITFNQMVDFSGTGKHSDIRWTVPHFTEYYYDADGTVNTINRWENMQPTVRITNFKMPGTSEIGAMRSYWYKEYVAPEKFGIAPYYFDSPHAGVSKIHRA